MATTAQQVQRHSDAGLTPADIHTAIVAGPANDNSFPNTGRTTLYVVAGAGGPVNITLVNQTSEDQQAGPNRVINIPASSTRVIGAIPPSVYNDSNGLVHVQVDTPANLATFYAFQSS